MDSGKTPALLRLVAMARFSFLKGWQLGAALAGLGLLLLLTVGGLGDNSSRAAAQGAALRLSATPLPLNRNDPAADRIGPLVFKGAVQLRSTDAAFGGISGLRAGPGGRFLAVTDTGNWLSFRTLEKQGRLVGVLEARMHPMLMADGQPAQDKEAGDAEALDWNPETGEAQVVFEQSHRTLQWRGIDPARPETLNSAAARTEVLPEMAAWPANGGGEAMVRWRALDGEVEGAKARLVISEDVVLEDEYREAVLTYEGRNRTIGLSGIAEHSPTDAVMIDERRMLVLHRRFNLRGAGAAISLFDLAPLFGKAAVNRVRGELLAAWEAPFLLDNMEGLAVVREGGDLAVYVVSDDNLSSLQKTLLMKFSLDLP